MLMSLTDRRIPPSVLNFLRLAEAFETRYKANASFATSSPPDNILVVLGAAASFSSGMPSWNELEEKVVEIAESCYSNPEDFVEEAWRKLSAIIGVKPPHANPEQSRSKLLDLASVEMLCSVACASDVIRERILQLFNQKYVVPDAVDSAGLRPQLGCELLAHFLKHRFIDHLITFNFDEVLDTALTNELGPNGYELILMDTQNPPQLKPTKPRLFKLHGTISIPQTLRFTHDNTGALPQSMINLLDDTLLIGNEVHDSTFPQRKTHIVSIGYSWNDKDFANWIISRREYIADITIIRLDDKPPDLLKPLYEEALTPVYIISNKKMSPAWLAEKSEKSAISIDQLLWALWNELERRFDSQSLPYFPISRHLILGYLFGPKPTSFETIPESFLHVHTTEARLRTEIYLHLIKCKGMVNISTMAHDPRIHSYLKKWRLFHSTENNLLDSLAVLVPNEFADVKETYFASESTLADLMNKICEQPSFQGDIVYEPILYPNHRCLELEQISHTKFMHKHFQRVFAAMDVEIVPGTDPTSDWLFNAPLPLETYLSLQQYSQKIIETEWTHLLVIAESGEWLFEDKFFRILMTKPSARKILFLRASDDALKEWQLRKEIKKSIKSRELELPPDITIIRAGLEWWEHNRHLTLAVNENTGIFLGGIYIRRPLKSSRISPMYLEHARDCTELFFTFLSYVRRLYDSNADPYRHDLCREVSRLAQHVDIESDLQPRLRLLTSKLNDCLTAQASK